MKKKKLTFSVIITTMNSEIDRVIKNLLPQLNFVDEVIISHQITDENIKPFSGILPKNMKYVFMREKGLSKNRNFALKFVQSDICYICDDDLNLKPDFIEKIKNAYISNQEANVITFQAENEKGEKHFNLKEGKHTKFSVLKVWSWGITFKKERIIKNRIYFDENFGLGAKYPTGEENIFLSDCYKKGLKMLHSDEIIAIHPNESSGTDYNKDLIIARIKVFKRIFGFLGGLAGVFYFTILHRKFYKEKFSSWKFFSLSFKSLVNAK